MLLVEIIRIEKLEKKSFPRRYYNDAKALQVSLAMIHLLLGLASGYHLL